MPIIEKSMIAIHHELLLSEISRAAPFLGGGGMHLFITCLHKHSPSIQIIWWYCLLPMEATIWRMGSCPSFLLDHESAEFGKIIQE